MRKRAAETGFGSENASAQAEPVIDPEVRMVEGSFGGLFGNMSGRARMNVMVSLVVALLLAGFIATSYFLPQYAQAWPTKYASCTGSGCHVLVDPNATIVTAINGVVGTTVSVPAGGSFEVDWKVNNVTSAGSNVGVGLLAALPTGWTIAKGTANSPAITGWNTVWDAADGTTGTAGWATANKFTVATEFSTSPDGYTINFDTSPWDIGTRNAAYDNATTGDKDGVADNMGTDAIITVPAGTAAGTYTMVVAGVGHDGSTKSHVKQTLTVTVTSGADTTKPVVSGFNATTPSLSRTIAVSGFTATDNTAVTGYMITTSSTAPLSGDAGWLGTAPTSYVVGADGTFTLYPWAKDAAGNVSLVYGSPKTVVVDTVLPTVSSTVPANAATAVTLNSTVTLNFSENVDCTTVTTTSVTISPAVTWNKTSCTAAQAVFTPAGQANSTSYTVTVGTGVKDTAGNAMTASYPFSYTTAAPAPNNPPAAPTSLTQYKSDAVTVVTKGQYMKDTTLVVKGTVTDPDGNTVKLEVEVVDVAASFTNTPTCSSALVASGTTATATCAGLPNGRFKWQARSNDSLSSTSSWTQY